MKRIIINVMNALLKPRILSLIKWFCVQLVVVVTLVWIFCMLTGLFTIALK